MGKIPVRDTDGSSTHLGDQASGSDCSPELLEEMSDPSFCVMNVTDVAPLPSKSNSGGRDDGLEFQAPVVLLVPPGICSEDGIVEDVVQIESKVTVGGGGSSVPSHAPGEDDGDAGPCAKQSKVSGSARARSNRGSKHRQLLDQRAQPFQAGPPLPAQPLPASLPSSNSHVRATTPLSTRRFNGSAES
ncbi:uncharacterized protein MONBRDRAFT_12814 [Monosiga brevicollis MX1]|uniref:Uncharacterized protein n=1 Tax=Monosiga brevicollis TaxID=81824 RepID=A9VDE6_MONBE|nr:uncharacterized protein MONBRDRAFT_12814 [Monosiga brevicollis MX1]EDQ84458.1 predicted protein [Monosiga brevicollis MX1]|eukprot:XP_001750753.1 hypothetical protein [Monosiga brevicollis MX1]